VKKESAIFRKPVNPAEFGILDYFDIVKEPMDLGTIQTRLDGDKYSSYEDFARDMRLVWSNCMLYNPADTPYHQSALKMSEKFELYESHV